MSHKMLLLAALAGLAGWTPACAQDIAPRFHVGESVRVIHPREARNWRGARNEMLQARIWYPVESQIAEHPRDIGSPDHPFYHGHAASLDAPLSGQRARYPLILMSHGTGGMADDLDWMAAALAEAGYMVAAVNHPGNNALEPMTWEGFNLWWERARDVSDLLDGLLVDPAFGSHIDRDRIGAAGFSLGGYTVLELAGARTNLAAFKAFCAGPEADAICHPPEMARIVDRPAAGAGLSPSTREALAQSGNDYRDARIKAVFAIAPALGQVFDAASIADVHIPVALLAGTADVHVPPRTNAAHIAALLHAPVTLVPAAGHYSFLPVCAAVALEKFPQLCHEQDGADRTAIHASAIAAARLFFDDVLQKPMN